MFSHIIQQSCPNLFINRIYNCGMQSRGYAIVANSREQAVYMCAVLELPDVNNIRSKSRIPAGTYDCEKIIHKKYGKCMRVLHVSGRDGILIHRGNYYYNTRGCILLGTDFKDINDDMLKDVVNSGIAVDKVYSLLSKKFTLTIK